MFNKIQGFFGKIWKFIANKYNAILHEPEQKLSFWVGSVVVFLLAAYLIALIDVGIRYSTKSIAQFVKIYLTSRDESFPFVGWVIGSTVVLAIIIALVNHFMEADDGRDFKIADSDVYGNGRDISKDELKTVCEIKTPEYTDRPILGMAPDGSNKVLGALPDAMDNRNIAIIGTPGSGKSFTICLPYIVQAIRRRESVIMTDTKGELWAKTVEFGRANGYVIRRLDLRDPLKSNGMEFLKEMQMSSARTKVFVHTIIANCSISDQYVGFAENLLTAICLYVERNPDIPPEDKTLPKVYEMISLNADKLEQNFEDARNRPEMAPALTSWNSFKLASDALRGNIINNLASSMQILSSEDYQQMLSFDEIDLTLPGKVPCLYYVSMSDQDDTTKFLSSLFFAFLFRNLVDYADSKPSQRLDVPCTVLFEEFAQVKVPSIDKQLSTVRSRGIGVIMIMQTIAQLKKDYRDDWITMLDECPIQICLAANGKEVSEYFSEKCGECTIEARTDQHNTYQLVDSGRYSTGYGKRAFRTPNEIRKIPKYHCLIVWQRFDTLVTETFGINRHPSHKYMKQTSAFTHIPSTDYAARMYFRQAEEQRVQIMNDWIAEGGQPMWYVPVPGPQNEGPENGRKPPEFLSYSDLEQQALKYSAAHPEINEKYKKAKTEARLKAAREIQEEMGHSEPEETVSYISVDPNIIPLHSPDEEDAESVPPEDPENTLPENTTQTDEPNNESVSAGSTAYERPNQQRDSNNKSKSAPAKQSQSNTTRFASKTGSNSSSGKHSNGQIQTGTNKQSGGQNRNNENDKKRTVVGTGNVTLSNVNKSTVTSNRAKSQGSSLQERKEKMEHQKKAEQSATQAQAPTPTAPPDTKPVNTPNAADVSNGTAGQGKTPQNNGKSKRTNAATSDMRRKMEEDFPNDLL